MPFQIDLEKYKIIDLAKEVVPNLLDPGDRPFVIEESRLGDGTYKFDIRQTHTHVGTHVESPWHYYHEGKTITDFPLEHFMGRARLLRAAPSPGAGSMTLAMIQEQLEAHRGAFEILLMRNDSGKTPLRVEMEAVPYIRDLKIKLLIFEAGIEFGEGVEDGRKFHDLLMSRDICLVEFPEQCRELDRDAFYIFALPMRVKGLDSAMCRLMAVVERYTGGLGDWGTGR
ncbi:MAG: cyclase family protein [Candidatus Omnitrophota bacterium]